MSGLIDIYQYRTLQSSFFSSIDIYTSRYNKEGNRSILKPRNQLNIEAVQNYVAVNFSGLNASVDIVRTYAPEVSTFVRSIRIEGDTTRPLFNLMFRTNQISAEIRSSSEDAIRELERSVGMSSRVANNITLAQKDVIGSFIEPYEEVLIKYRKYGEIKSSLLLASLVLKNFIKAESFKPVMADSRLNLCGLRHLKISKPLLEKEWSEQIKSEILDSLYSIGRIICGKANLESALLQTGPNLPDLKTQEEVILELFEKKCFGKMKSVEKIVIEENLDLAYELN
jgi:hypothetical protein